MLHTIAELTERLTPREAGLEAWLWLPLVRLLAQGDPVKVTDLATAELLAQDTSVLRR